MSVTNNSQPKPTKQRELGAEHSTSAQQKAATKCSGYSTKQHGNSTSKTKGGLWQMQLPQADHERGTATQGFTGAGAPRGTRKKSALEAQP